jgi:exopolysaccharide production protein ExoZ
VFAIVLLVPRNLRVLVTGLFFTVVVLCAPLCAATTYGPEIASYGNFRIFEFLFGMIIGEAYVNRLHSVPAGVAWLITLAGLAVLMLGLPFLPLVAGSWPQVMIENALPSAFIVFGVLSLEGHFKARPFPFLAYLGDASYSMYLSHVFTLGALRFLWGHAGLERISVPFAIAFGFASLIVTIIGAIVVYQCIEKPMLQAAQRAYRSVTKRPPNPVRLPRDVPTSES